MFPAALSLSLQQIQAAYIFSPAAFFVSGVRPVPFGADAGSLSPPQFRGGKKRLKNYGHKSRERKSRKRKKTLTQKPQIQKNC